MSTRFTQRGIKPRTDPVTREEFGAIVDFSDSLSNLPSPVDDVTYKQLAAANLDMPSQFGSHQNVIGNIRERLTTFRIAAILKATYDPALQVKEYRRYYWERNERDSVTVGKYYDDAYAGLLELNKVLNIATGEKAFAEKIKDYERSILSAAREEEITEPKKSK